jgi:hypothetical protein
MLTIAVANFVTNAQCSLTLNKAEGGCNGTPTVISANAWMSLPVNPPSPQNYCASQANMSSEADISRFRFGAIDNSSICASLAGSQGTSIGMSGEYSDFTISSAPVATFQRGSSHVVDITSVPCNWTGNYLVLAFIDYNQDGDFDDAGEEVYMSHVSFLNNTSELNSDSLITIPATASLGVTRMRITNIWNATISNQGCGNFMCGEVEDYLINIDQEVYTYSWSPAAGLNSTTSQFVTATPTVQTTYTCIATAPNSSTSTSTITVGPSSVSGTVAALNPSCNNGFGEINVTPIGGQAPFVYNFYDANNMLLSSNSTGNMTGLPAGNYTTQINDAAGCGTTLQSAITIPTAVQSNAVGTDAQCYGTNTGSITLTTSGGTGTYTYTYNGTTTTANVLSNLSTGTYQVLVADANNCTQEHTVNIAQPADFSLYVAGGNNTAQVNVIGGTGTYTYNWMPGNYNTSIIAGVAAGTYNVTVTDQNGCNKTQTIQVVNPTGTSNIINSKDIKVFPNPIANELNVEFKAGINTIDILDMQGKTIQHASFNNATKASLNVSTLSQGLYILKINKTNITTITKG